jgi:hypothetical protein
MTHRGRVVERRTEIARDRVMSMGVSVSALAGLGPQDAGAAGVSQRPAAGEGAAAAGSGSSSSGGTGGSGSEGGGTSRSGSAAGEEGGDGGSGLFHSSTFRLLLREIRAEGRAGGDDDRPARW